MLLHPLSRLSSTPESVIWVTVSLPLPQLKDIPVEPILQRGLLSTVILIPLTLSLVMGLLSHTVHEF